LGETLKALATYAFWRFSLRAVENITRGLSQEKSCSDATGGAGAHVEKTRGGKMYVAIRDMTSASR